MLYMVNKNRKRVAETFNEQIEVEGGKVVAATGALAHLIGEDCGYVFKLLDVVGHRPTPTTKRMPLVTTKPPAGQYAGGI